MLRRSQAVVRSAAYRPLGLEGHRGATTRCGTSSWLSRRRLRINWYLYSAQLVGSRKRQDDILEPGHAKFDSLSVDQLEADALLFDLRGAGGVSGQDAVGGKIDGLHAFRCSDAPLRHMSKLNIRRNGHRLDTQRRPSLQQALRGVWAPPGKPVSSLTGRRVGPALSKRRQRVGSRQFRLLQWQWNPR